LSSDLIITITNPDGISVSPVMVELPTCDSYLDRPTRIQAKIEKHSGLDPQGIAQVTSKGKIILLGNVTKFDQANPEYDTLILDSAEFLLDQRIGAFYRFPAGTTLNAMLSEALGAGVVGLLAQANSMALKSWVQFSGSVYVYRDKDGNGGGTTSRLGTIATIYQATTALTKVAGVPTVAGTWYQSATELYLITTNKTPNDWIVLIPNSKDTNVRLGTISMGTTTFNVCFEVGASKIWPTIKTLILAAGLEWSLRYEKDGYAYLDASPIIGKGTASIPITTYVDGTVETPMPDAVKCEITQGIIDGAGPLQALVGQGAGSGLTQQCSAAIDLVTKGTWREAIYSAGGLFSSMLKTATEKVFANDYQDPVIYNVRTADQDWSQSVGNYVQLLTEGYQPIVRRIKHIQMRTAGDMLLECGQRLRTLQELLKSDNDLQRTLQAFYGAHVPTGWSWPIPQENIDSFTGISHEFLLASTDGSTKDPNDKTLGAGEIDPNFPYMVLLNLKIGWYTASIYQATNPNISHGNVGLHGGYGSSTSQALQNAHQVPENTGRPSTGVYGAVTLYGHYHPLSFNAAHQHALRTAESSELQTGDAGPAPGHWHYYRYPYATQAGPYTISGNTGQSPVGTSYLATGIDHTHTIPSQMTLDAGLQSHNWNTSANQRAGSPTHPTWDATLTGLINQFATGSLKYLTLDVKINGSEVPGSPFNGNLGTGLYIGDDISNVDISSLVTIGQKNTIAYAITEFGGSGTVKCSLSGGINVNGVVSAF
jgi:hypothetical protein